MIVLPTAKRFSAMTHYGIVAMPVVPLSATARALALRIAGTRSGKQARLLAKKVE